MGAAWSKHLVAAGERVYNLNARWTEQERRARNRGKTDARDAQAITRYLLREGALRAWNEP